MAKRRESVFDQIESGLQEVAGFYRGELTLRTVQLPAPPPKLAASRIKQMRTRMKMSQGIFAATLNVSLRTVQSWEQGRRKPSDAALRLLQVLNDHPRIVRQTIGGTRTRSDSRNVRSRGAV